MKMPPRRYVALRPPVLEKDSYRSRLLKEHVLPGKHFRLTSTGLTFEDPAVQEFSRV
jgi:hypothetical protein